MEQIDVAHVLPTPLDVRRKFFVAEGGVRDLQAECIVVQDKDFDVDSSIFGVLPEKIKMAAAANQLKPYWSDTAVSNAEKAYQRVKPVGEERKPLLQFMATECDFKLEHADGSFMDHLTFCRDYCATHYSSVSPTPLFIHSIMGVGTNVRSAVVGCPAQWSHTLFTQLNSVFGRVPCRFFLWTQRRFRC